MPKKVILIAAVTIDGYIARHSLEITRWSKDLHVFKKQTMGHPLIMGFNTNKTLSSHLKGRRVIIVQRNDDPANVLKSIKEDICFIAGGGKTYHCFYPFVTHLYITPHPHVFGSGIPLFSGSGMKELKTKFLKLLEIDKENGIFQYQYEVLGS